MEEEIFCVCVLSYCVKSKRKEYRTDLLLFVALNGLVD